MDVMQPLGFNIDCSTLTINWNEHTIPFRPANYFDDKQLFLSVSALLDDEDLLDSTGYRTKSILSSKYKEVDVDNVASQQKHLSQRQQQDLAAVLKQHTKLFSGKLGLYKKRKVHLELEPNAKPVSSRPYGVPKMHQTLFKKELDRLEKEGVLSRTGASEWLSPTFIVPKSSNARFTTFQGSRTSYQDALATSTSPRLTFQCSLRSLLKQAKRNPLNGRPSAKKHSMK